MQTRPGNQTDLNELSILDQKGWGLFRAALQGGITIVWEREGLLTGYAAAIPLPGLIGHNDFRVFVAHRWRRQGWGSRLLAELIAGLAPTGTNLISTVVYDLGEPAAQFMQKQGFFLEHTEWDMRRDLTGELPPVIWPAGYALRTYSRPEAMAHFRMVYEQAFTDLPSYQPYVSDEEVDRALDQAEDLRFVVWGDRPVGFVWARKVTIDLGEIEPIGVAVAYQRQGLGKALLAEGMHYLAGQGYQITRLGVWADNQKAINLYQKFGFQHVNSRYFLALQIGI